MTYNRANSLQRLLISLVASTYLGDRVDLDIWIDRPRVNNTDGQIDKEVRQVADELFWPNGFKTVYTRHHHGGLYAQWLRTWNVTEALHTGEFAVFLEDNLEVSSSFYVWLRTARQRYAKMPDVGGFSLCRMHLPNKEPSTPGHTGQHFSFPEGAHAFKYRLQGSWGFAPDSARWRGFLQWYAEMRRKGSKPYVMGHLTSARFVGEERRTRRKYGLDYAPTMWTQWWVKFADETGYFTVTPWLEDNKTLCANWQEPGIHFDGKTRDTDASIYRGTPDRFVWPRKLISLDWDGVPIATNATN